MGCCRPNEVLVLSETSPSYRAMRSNSPVVFDELDPDTTERLARRPGGLEFTARYASFLAVPLTARGLVLGCMTFCRAPSSPSFGPADIAAADELASQAGVSIDNARLYDRERRAAVALQQGMLPGRVQGPGRPGGGARGSCRSACRWSAGTGTTSWRCPAAGPR